MKLEAVGDGELLIGLTRDQLVEAERIVCATIAREVQPADNVIPARIPHDAFASWIKKVSRSAPLELFTTNYDLLFERSLESAHVPVFDGFVGTHQPFFYPDCLEDDTLLPKPRWLRLWKLHGSVNWRSHDGRTGTVIIRDQPTDRGELIFPSYLKYDESRKQPYMAYMDRLSRVLNHEHSLLVTCGYSFGDDHINAIVYGALDNRSTANAIALAFGDLTSADALVQSALRRPNLTVIAKNGGVISGVWGTWKLTKPVDEKTHSFMDVAFDSSAAPDDTASPAASAVSLGGTDAAWRLQLVWSFLKRHGSRYSMTGPAPTLIGVRRRAGPKMARTGAIRPEPRWESTIRAQSPAEHRATVGAHEEQTSGFAIRISLQPRGSPVSYY